MPHPRCEVKRKTDPQTGISDPFPAGFGWMGRFSRLVFAPAGESGSLFRTYDGPDGPQSLIRAMQWNAVGRRLMSRDCFIIRENGQDQIVFDDHHFSLFKIEKLKKHLMSVGFHPTIYDGFTQKIFGEDPKRAVFVCT